MNLQKIFDFKGLYHNGSKASAPVGYFRRLLNTYKDRAGRLKPFGAGLPVPMVLPSNKPSAYSSTTWAYPILSTVYKGGIFQLHKGSVASPPAVGIASYGTDVLDPKYVNGSDYDLYFSNKYSPSSAFTTAVVNGKLFINEYVDFMDYESSSDNFSTPYSFNHKLNTFDGLRMKPAGLPTPYSHFNPNSSGTKRVRAVYMTLGLDAELTFSNYIEVIVDATPVYNHGAYSSVGVKRADIVGNVATIFPKQRASDDTLSGAINTGYFPEKWIRQYATVSINGNGEASLTATEVSNNLAVGDWLFTISDNFDAYYFQIKSVAGLSITFESKIKFFNSITLTWEDMDLFNGPPSTHDTMTDFENSILNKGWSNVYVVISYSNATGTDPFKVSKIGPVFWSSTHTETISLTDLLTTSSAPVLGIITATMSDWYDHTIVKTRFPKVKGITNYNELLVGFDDNALYFHDTSAGGSTEMVSGISNLVPFGSEYGKITAICGSENFLFMSRERKNYVITGELTTGNVNIRECDIAVAGAIRNAVSNAFSDRVIFVNRTGIFSVNSGGQIVEISKDIRDLFIFGNQDGVKFSVDVFKSKKDIKTDVRDGSICKIVLDEYRGFILFLTGHIDASGAVTESNILVHDSSDGCWYEWEGGNATTVECLEGVVHKLGSQTYIEDGVPREDQLFLFTWLNMGEPSLEKQVNQIKFYGETSGIKLLQQNDFALYDSASTAFNTYEDYVPESASDYAHKKRFNSSKAQVTSFGFFGTGGGNITLEGVEIEISTIQSGVKK